MEMASAVPVSHAAHDVMHIIEEPWKASFVGDVLRSFADTFPDHPDRHALASFAIRSSVLPLALVLLGIFISFGVTCRMCNCCGPKRFPPPGTAPPRRRRSTSCPVVVLSILSVLLVAFGFHCWTRTGDQALDYMRVVLDKADEDFVGAIASLRQLWSTGDTARSSINLLRTSCPPEARSHLQVFTVRAKPQIDLLTETLHHQIHAMNDVYGEAKEHKEFFMGVSDYLTYIFAIPLVLVVLGCFAVNFFVCLSKSGRFSGCCVRLLAIFVLAPMILAVTTLASTQLYFGVMGASFCGDVDNNVVKMIAMLGQAQRSAYEDDEGVPVVGNPDRAQEAVQLALHYIKNVGENKFISMLENVNTQLQEVENQLNTYGDQIDTFCPSWGKRQAMLTSLKSGQESVSALMTVVSRDNVYDLYKKSVRKSVCKVGIVGLGWLTSFELIAGLVCLPLVICVANAYLERRSAETREIKNFEFEMSRLSQ
eukprot:TRINITY_DN15405_c0_g1_i1.p1 TRINITY_DN15405_c0_g1~~TRINITY_DN15405_c0_g1_i1.p1  ORF type:complete len:513 (+),score=84.43 TRINITY_DN15405_c0_g1_i1:97-1539(+)